MKSFRDYLGLSNSCSYDVDDVTDWDFKISVALLMTVPCPLFR